MKAKKWHQRTFKDKQCNQMALKDHWQKPNNGIRKNQWLLVKAKGHDRQIKNDLWRNPSKGHVDRRNSSNGIRESNQGLVIVKAKWHEWQIKSYNLQKPRNSLRESSNTNKCYTVTIISYGLSRNTTNPENSTRVRPKSKSFTQSTLTAVQFSHFHEYCIHRKQFKISASTTTFLKGMAKWFSTLPLIWGYEVWFPLFFLEAIAGFDFQHNPYRPAWWSCLVCKKIVPPSLVKSCSFFFLKTHRLPSGLRPCNSDLGNFDQTFRFIKLLISLLIAGIHFSLSSAFSAAL